jgi:acetate kinase
MGTRSGDVDPSLHLFLQQKKSLSLEEVMDLLTRKSGLLGVSGVSHDMRSVVEAVELGNHQARLALDLFCYRLARAILGLAAGLERVDALIFTGGIGENSAIVRSKTLEHLAILHPEIDQAWNERNGQDSNGRITKENGLACFVIPTNEELMIARQTAALALRGQSGDGK